MWSLFWIHDLQTTIVPRVGLDVLQADFGQMLDPKAVEQKVNGFKKGFNSFGLVHCESELNCLFCFLCLLYTDSKHHKSYKGKNHVHVDERWKLVLFRSLTIVVCPSLVWDLWFKLQINVTLWFLLVLYFAPFCLIDTTRNIFCFPRWSRHPPSKDCIIPSDI